MSSSLEAAGQILGNACAGWIAPSASDIHPVWSGHILHFNRPRMANGQVRIVLTQPLDNTI